MRGRPISALGLSWLLWCGLLLPIPALGQSPAGTENAATDSDTAATAEAPDFLLVIHRNNPTTSLKAKTLSRIFLKKIKRWDSDIWPGDVRIVPLDLQEKSEVRRLFTRAIHDKSTGAIKSYWQRELFSGRNVPPTEVESDEEMMQRIVDEEGAIGYVSGSAELPEQLKVLEVEE